MEIGKGKNQEKDKTYLAISMGGSRLFTFTISSGNKVSLEEYDTEKNVVLNEYNDIGSMSEKQLSSIAASNMLLRLAMTVYLGNVINQYKESYPNNTEAIAALERFGNACNGHASVGIRKGKPS